jgi:serine protease Do
MTRFARTRLTVVAAAAFVGGVVFAAGVNLTPFGYAQQRSGSTQPPAQATQAVNEASTAFVQIADAVRPAVVSISTERAARSRDQRRPRSQQVPPGFEDFFDQFDQRRQQPVEGSGSGFIVSKDGYILTNNHVVQDADRVNVTLLDKRVFRAKIVGRDPTTDVAVIKIEGDNFATIPLGNDGGARIGEWVLAVGNPLGLDFTVTAGIISAKGRSGSLRGLLASQYAIVDYIQTDAAINPGNSGGPLVNSRGEVIGINSAIASQTGFYSGYGFAIPVTLARDVMDDLIKYGRVRRAVLGVSINDVRPEDAQAAGLQEIRGAIVGGFTGDNSPAERAGLEPGDVIVAVEGKPVDRVATLQRLIREHQPGETVSLDVMRYGQRRSYKVRLIEAPADEENTVASRNSEEEATRPISSDKLGISIEPVTAERARQARLSEDQRGVLVTDVDPMGSSYRNLSPGDIITEIGTPSPRRAVRTVSEFEAVLNRASNGSLVSLLVYNVQAQQTRVVNLRIGQ